MHTHANARLTQRGRLRLVSQHLNHHRSLAELAAEAGISLRCAYKWLARYRSGGAAALVDRRSVRRSQRRTLRRSAAPATCRGAQASTPAPAPHRPAAGG
ncbi:leucine zipper domain-containing protein, partial [Synechococcus sp. CB0205]|uniref:leucine zipper domain-containing protein n=1 Tax=Synechococcus sp. CB0205 TaxID=232363 RepID=UPI001E634970